MTAIAAITISDGTTNHVMTPVQTHPPIYKNVADADVPTEGQETVTIEVIRARGNGADRVRVTTAVPVMEVISDIAAAGYIAPPKVAFVITAVTDFYLNKRSTPAQRLLGRNLHRNLLNDAQVIDAVEKLAPPY